MQNSPTHDPVAYITALNDEQNAFDDALQAIRDEQQAGRLTVAAAATERIGLLERHLARLAALRAEHLGGSS
jgi:chromosome condensin MukBEF ATPase and DNA-binding subunit MukB